MWKYPNKEDYFDDEIDTENPIAQQAFTMRNYWEMNHSISREERCKIIAKADSILWELIWKEDYRD